MQLVRVCSKSATSTDLERVLKVPRSRLGCSVPRGGTILGPPASLFLARDLCATAESKGSTKNRVIEIPCCFKYPQHLLRFWDV